MEGVPTENTSPELKAYISTGCVILPAFIAVWYYYSKRACRRVVAGFLKNEPCSQSDNVSVNDNDFAMMEESFDDQYQQRDDVNNYSSTELTNRLVKWINRQNVFTDYTYNEYRVAKQTRENLFGSNTPSKRPAAPKMATENGGHNRLVVDTNTKFDRDRLCLDEDRDDSILFWECIPDPYQDQFDFCSPKTATSSDMDESTIVSKSSILSADNDHKLSEAHGPNDQVIV
mmetsp:Transcript_21194/g.58934  ORF Transcript_21194/g.58934 Transcript_21194/m.58934 type:complete len:230 (-) Transcript_21194:1052-1741(-)